jgi:hypothetical protein
MTTIATTITTRMISMQLIRPKAAGRKPTTVMAAGVATVTTSMIVRRNLPVSMSCPVVVCELPAWKKTRVSHQFFLNGTFIIYSYKVPNAMRPDLALDISFTSYFRGCCPPIFRDISTSNNFCSVLLIVAHYRAHKPTWCYSSSASRIFRQNLDLSHWPVGNCKSRLQTSRVSRLTLLLITVCFITTVMNTDNTASPQTSWLSS